MLSGDISTKWLMTPKASEASIDTITRDEAGKLSLSLRGRADKLPVSRLYAHLFKAM